MIKMVLALRHGMLPATLHADPPSREIDWSGGAVRLLTGPRDWPPAGRPRRAAVSSFGISGTNAHVLLEQAPPRRRPGTSRPGTSQPPPVAGAMVVPLPVSGATATARAAQAARLREFLLARPEVRPVDLAWSLATTRAALAHRAVVLATDRADCVRGLTALATGADRDALPHTDPVPPGPPRTEGARAEVVRGTVEPAGRRVVFVFPGQGGQWPGMAAELLATSPEFARRLAACQDALAPHVDWSLADVLAEGPPERVDVLQPVLWAVLVALAGLWQDYGVRPAAVVGHSQGEIAAACVAGVLSMADGALVVCRRGRALRALGGRGGMLSLARGRAEVAALIRPWGARVSVAAENSPAATVIAGDPGALRSVRELCAREGIEVRPLPVDYASHCGQVDAVREEVLAALSGIRPRPAEVPMYSTVVDGPPQVPAGAPPAGYWYENLRRPVEFRRALDRLIDQGYRTFLEVGPHPVLGLAIRETAQARDTEVAAVATLRRGEGGRRRFLTALAQLQVRGVPVDLAPAFAGTGAAEIDLPAYPFRRRRYWLPDRARALAPVAVDAPGASDDGGTADAVTGPAGPDLAALPVAARRRALVDLVRARTADVLGYPDPTEVDVRRPFRDLGADSAAVVALRDRLAVATGLTLPVSVAFSYPTPDDLAGYLGGRLGGDPDAAAVVLDEVERLARAMATPPGDDQVRRTVLRRLEALLSSWRDPLEVPGPGGARRGPAERGAEGHPGELALAAGRSTTAEQLFELIDRELGGR
jgi:acyl transferase domain-containing protein